MVVYRGMVTTISTDAASGRYRMALTSGTNIDLTRLGVATTSRTIHLSVIQFAAGVVKSLQRINVNMAGVASNTATVTAVTASKTLLNYTGWNTDKTTSQPTAAWLSGVVTNGTTITVVSETAPVAGSYGGEVVEFN
jgi:hypothetical protein